MNTLLDNYWKHSEGSHSWFFSPCLLEHGTGCASKLVLMSHCFVGNETADGHTLQWGLSWMVYMSFLFIYHACTSHNFMDWYFFFAFSTVHLAYSATNMLPAQVVSVFFFYSYWDEGNYGELVTSELFLGRLNSYWMLTGSLSYRFNSASASSCSLLMKPLYSLGTIWCQPEGITQ